MDKAWKCMFCGGLQNIKREGTQIGFSVTDNATRGRTHVNIAKQIVTVVLCRHAEMISLFQVQQKTQRDFELSSC